MKEKKPSFPVALASLTSGTVADIRALEQISVREPCEIILYFEKDLAYNSTYEQDMNEYGTFEEHDLRSFRLNTRFYNKRKFVSKVNFDLSQTQ